MFAVRESGQPPIAIAETPDVIDDSPADRRFYLPLGIVVLILSGWLIFFRLGHYPLWSDETETALFARAVARSGVLALLDHNLFAYRDGVLLKDLRGRYEPPGPYYFDARLWAARAPVLFGRDCRLRSAAS